MIDPASVAWFLDLEVEPGHGLDEGAALRFKAITAPRPVTRALFEAGGLDGEWRLQSIDLDGRASVGPPRSVKVEDSSDGTALLIYGGEGGLRLVHAETGNERREPYLLLAVSTEAW